ncbi:topoisomerase DNA-binding C4 zinc finger domain-containing protein [Ensifer sesbaniae]|uniref:topoisomerase DNA-binding C4 zinc finger domain-containing protein n=1 Tax=Ensifer sesbaniae TaxID=1214071 RepID=UPI002000C229|nr:topoisomerase DNA-binding C4 zinc finger domain-containing protein [Ensifer sesbaniae]
MYLVADSRQPSRYIRELCEIAGDDIRFETTEGTALRQCPTCLVGQIVEKRNRDGSVFCGCSQFPDCSRTERVPPRPAPRLRRKR